MTVILFAMGASIASEKVFAPTAEGSAAEEEEEEDDDSDCVCGEGEEDEKQVQNVDGVVARSLVRSLPAPTVRKRREACSGPRTRKGN